MIKRMVGMDAQVIYEESKNKDSVYEESLEPRAQANGNMILHSEDNGSPTMTDIGEGNTKGPALCPITPTLRENGDSIFVTSTPLSVESPQLPNVGPFKSTKNVELVASDLNGSPRTPDEGVFDPFAPGPDEMLLAPICKKLVKASQKIVARRLNFDDIDDFPAFKDDNSNADTLSEKVLLESVYGTLLEAIILKQSEEFFAENPSLEMEGVHTPTSPPRLTGVAETCPGAPLKVTAGKSRNIDRGLCRKLEF